MKIINKILIVLLISTCACGNRNLKEKQKSDTVPQEQEATRKNCNAVYYWKTTFRLSSEEKEFLKSYQIERLYLRYFDVGRDPDFQDQVLPVPVATLQFIDAVPSNLEVIPTVFIDNNLFKDCDMNKYAELLVKRILTMTETNNIPNVREIQLDCDWTQTTEDAYFSFLKQVRNLLERDTIPEIPKKRRDPITLSTTIRLHQLKTKIPPVDRGVLMCYNTGGVRNPQTGNSILSANDVALYAKNIQSYSLPLDVAYPTFSWAVWFSDNTFQALLRNLTPENENLTLIKDNQYRVKNIFYQEGNYLWKNSEIRFESSDFKEIIQAKRLLEKHLENYSVIVYHLDYNNLLKYSENEITQIYAR